MKQRVVLRVLLGLVGCAVPACGGDEAGKTSVAPGTTACEKLNGIATRLGCETSETCTLADPCEAEYRALFDCIASDYSQCHCESDGGLNCEGAWKPNEGSARCIDEYQPMNACEDANGG